MSKLFSKILVLLMATVLAFTAVGCNTTPPAGDNSSSSSSDSNSSIDSSIDSSSEDSSSDSAIDPKPIVKVIASVDKDELKEGESANLSVEIANSDDLTYNVTASLEKQDASKFVNYEDNIIVYKKSVPVDSALKITVTSNADKNAFAVVTIKLVATVTPGKVGNLTSAMIEKISNHSITVEGTLSDIYEDTNNASLNKNKQYNINVAMEEDKWIGSWSIKPPENIRPEYIKNIPVITDSYEKGTDTAINQKGETGASLNRVYINRMNTVKRRALTDGRGFKVLWNDQHMWNHANAFDVNRFQYDIDNPTEYKYTMDIDKNEPDAWFATYLAFSFTPMLDETFSDIVLIVEGEEVTGMKAKTQTVYYNLQQDGSYDGLSYTEVVLSFKNIGTTKVADPKPYDKPANGDKLQAALDEMKNADNYSFHAIEHQMAAPGLNPDDYQPGEGANFASTGANTAKDMPVDNLSSKGVVGTKGWITKDGALFAETSKYQMTSDGRDYRTEHHGFKQNADNTYDYFEFEYKNKSTYKARQIKEGNYLDKEMPGFNLSANIFDYSGKEDVIIMEGLPSIPMYVFTLRETAVTKEVAKQLSYLWSTADSSVDGKLKILVDEYGHLYSTKIYYNITDTFYGYHETFFSDVGTTEIHKDVFSDSVYVKRNAPKTWAETITKYFITPDDKHSREEATNIVMDAIFPSKEQANIPSPVVFREIFGDEMNGPFYDEKDRDGKIIKSIHLSTSFDNMDEDGYPVQRFNEIAEKIDAVLTRADVGFAKDNNNSDLTGGETGRSDLYLSYLKGGIQIVVMNNHTGNIFIEIHNIGNWSLNR